MVREKEFYILMAEMFYSDLRVEFRAMGEGFRYTEEQKNFAFNLIDEYGIRATARILEMPRRTLQRWCQQYGVKVKHCPVWVFEWAERRRKRREFWQRKGYY